jgi:hypothetical protein
MPEYIFYLIDYQERVIRVSTALSEDDDGANAAALKILDDPSLLVVQIWDGARLVGVVERKKL